MIKKYWSIAFLAIAIVVFIASKASNKADRVLLRATTFTTNNGWGYDILTNDTIYIHQPNIPAISSNKPFATQQQALLTAKLVIQKIKRHSNLAVTIAELDSLGVH